MADKIDTKLLHGREYVDLFESNQSAQRLARLIKRIPLNRQDSVLDCGCGNGMLLPLIDSQIQEYTGIDFSQEFIDSAKNQHPKSESCAKFLCEDLVNHCNRHPKAYDAAFAMDLSEHIEDSEWRRILTAIHCSLKENGKLYLHTPNRSFFVEKMKEKNFILKQFPEHIAVRTEKENCQLITASGFSNTHVTKLAHYNILRILHPLSYLPFAGRWFSARLLITAKKQ